MRPRRLASAETGRCRRRGEAAAVGPAQLDAAAAGRDHARRARSGGAPGSPPAPRSWRPSRRRPRTSPSSSITSITSQPTAQPAGCPRRCGRRRTRPATSPYLAQPPRRDHPRERDDAAADALAERDHVGHGAEVLDREPVAGAAEPGDHLVGDQQHLVAVAHLPHGRQIAVGQRHRRARRTGHRLDDERRHVLGAAREDGGLERRRALLGGVRVRHPRVLAQQRARTAPASATPRARGRPSSSRGRTSPGSGTRPSPACPAAPSRAPPGASPTRSPRSPDELKKHHSRSPGAIPAIRSARSSIGSLRNENR